MEEYTIGLDYGSLSARGVLVSTKDGSVLAECESVYKNGCITDKLPDGTKIEYSKAVPEGEILCGYFKEYKLPIRSEMIFDSTDQVRWIEEEIGYKISGRADGKMTDKKYFTRLEYEPVYE